MIWSQVEQINKQKLCMGPLKWAWIWFFAADSDPADSSAATVNKTHCPSQSEAFHFPANVSLTAVLTSCCASQPEKKVLPSKTQANKLLAGANVGLEGASEVIFHLMLVDVIL